MKSIANTGRLGNLARCILRGRPVWRPRVEGPQASDTLGLQMASREGLKPVRIFWQVCIVFISPPGVELCMLPLNCACFVCL